MLKLQDADSLAYLLKQPGFVMTAQDFNSFISYAFQELWLNGVKTFLQSHAAHFYFQNAFHFDEQRIFIERVIKSIIEFQDIKQKRLFWHGVIEDILTRKPYVKHLALFLLETETKSAYEVEAIKLAKECIKGLTSEDLWQFHALEQATSIPPMQTFESKYPPSMIQGQLAGSKLDLELAKLIYRYITEAKPTEPASVRSAQSL